MWRIVGMPVASNRLLVLRQADRRLSETNRLSTKRAGLSADMARLEFASLRHNSCKE